MGRIGTRTAWGSLLGAGTAAVFVGAATVAAVAAGRAPTLSASSHTAGLPAVAYGESIRLSGHESHARRTTVLLQADPFPFGAGFRTVAREPAHGDYAFTVTPRRAIQYRVVVKGPGAATSRTLTVYVHARVVRASCNLCTNSNSSGAHRLVIKAALTPGGVGPVYFYYGQVNGSSRAPKNLALVKVVPPHVTSRDVSFTVAYEVHFPSGPSRFRYTYCRRDNEAADGYGLPGHHHCGDPTVNANAYLG